MERLLVVLLVQLLRMVGSGAAPGIEHMTMYDFDPAAQHTWLTMGKTDNVTLLDEAWAKYKLPSLIELTKSGPQSLWCFTNGTHNPLVPCGGRGSAEWDRRLQAFGAAMRPRLLSGACVGAFLGDELMAAWDLSWSDLSYVADGLRQVLGPRALLYENDAFHEGLLQMPHVPRSLNFFSADGDYGFIPFEGIKAAYEQHILDKLAPNQSAFVIPGTYECDGPKMEAPSGTYWNCVPGNNSYDAFIASKLDKFVGWAAAEPRITGINAWHYNNRCVSGVSDYQCGCATPQRACIGWNSSNAGTPAWWQAGAMSMPLTLDKLQAIGVGIKAGGGRGHHNDSV